jgi:hypothetical protein
MKIRIETKKAKKGENGKTYLKKDGAFHWRSLNF